MIVVLLIVLAAVAYVLYNEIQNVQVGGSYSMKGGYGGGAGLGVILEYPDGRTKTITPQTLRYTFLPLSVYMNGEQIAKITWITYVYLDWEGDLICLELSGPMQVKVSESGLVLRKENMWRKTNVNWNMPNKKAWVEMWRFTLTADDIEGSIRSSGTYNLVCTSNVTATATFSNGITNTKAATAQITITITIQAAQLSVLKVDLQANAYKS